RHARSGPRRGGKEGPPGGPIRVPELAGQVWVKGEAKVRAYATPRSTLAALDELAARGQAVRVAFVHDRETGVKLLASRAFYVEDAAGKRGVVAAFLTRERAA